MEVDRIITGTVEDIDKEKHEMKLKINIFDKIQTVPIYYKSMPDWMLKKGVRFQTKIPYQCVINRNLDSVLWGEFININTDESFEDVVSYLDNIFYPKKGKK